ncbi:hypothetical protein, partial [Pseudomonas hunanensis]|uniref:hypothetical protein n=1 Tax=Pseudomonas hunanensis TaxID=1247546 RepID=UPI00286C010D
GWRIAALSLCLFTSGFVVWLAGLRPAICIGSTGLFAGQARSYRDCAEFKIGDNPVGAGLSREEARISTTQATIEDNARPDASRNFAASGGWGEGTRSAGPVAPPHQLDKPRIP